MNINTSGQLYVVATPIGNLQDISPRALSVLKKVQCIAAEDTRHSGSLLKQFNIETPLVSLHEHNERERVNFLLKKLQAGESIALISDAGTPLISDPGFHLVHEARALKIKVIPIPGPCAAITALSASGLSVNQFVFEGFLPVKNKARRDHLEKLREETRTLIFYEAPHRILAFLETLCDVFGSERKAVIARELTKLYETILDGTLGELCECLQQDPQQQRGEFVVLVAGAPESSPEKTFAAQKVLEILLETLSVKQAAEIAAKITGEKKNALYQQALKLKKE